MNKTKTREQKTTKATAFCAQKLLRGGKLGVSLHSKCFGKKVINCLETVPITSNTLLLKRNPGAFFLLDKNSFFLLIYREYYGFERTFFTLRHFLHFFLLFSRLPLKPAVQPQSQQSFMLIFETQPRDDYLFESKQSTTKVCRQVLFKSYGCLIKNLLLTGFDLFSRQVACQKPHVLSVWPQSFACYRLLYCYRLTLRCTVQTLFYRLLTGFELFSQQVSMLKSECFISSTTESYSLC